MDSFWLVALIELGVAAIAPAGFYLVSRTAWGAKRMGLAKAEARWMASGLALMCLMLYTRS